MTYRPCPCKSWGNCSGYSTYSLNEIIMCRSQVLWLLKADIEFDKDDAPGSRRVKPHASFVALSDLWAEFDYRMTRAGRDGETLRHEVAELNVYDPRRLSPSAKVALNYVAGAKRKRQSCAQWLADRRYKSDKSIAVKRAVGVAVDK
mgnify:FL=1